MKKSIILSYSAPEVCAFEVAAERGYSISGEVVGGVGTTLPGFGSENDELVY